MKKYIRFIPSIILIALIFAVCTTFLSKRNVVSAQTSTITFGVAGDFSGGSSFSKTISNMAAAQLNFVVPVGDFAYSSDVNTWISTVKTAFPAGFPFQIIAGNHDNNVGIAPYQSGLPNQISSISTDPLTVYGEQYYFDYPVQNPLVRVILLGQNEGSPSYTYPSGSANYNWVSASIDGARAKNIPWVVAGMHKNCITAGTKGCDIGTALLNLFITKRVDLVVQGHDHNYQRTFPLRNAATDPVGAAGCSTVSTSFNAACINSSSSTSYPSTNGTTVMIIGTGGQGLYANSNTSQNNYFAAKQFSQYGFVKFTMTPTQLTGTFISNTAGAYSDNFTITKGAVTITPTVSVTATITPTKSPTTTPNVTVNPNCPKKALGDANCDGKTDLVDFEIWRREFSGLVTTTSADFNGNGTTKPDLVDFEIWRRNLPGI